MASLYHAVLSPLKSAADAAKKAMDIRDSVKFGEVAADLYKQVLTSYQAAITVQERETQLIEENSALKKRIIELETDQSRRQNYEPITLPPAR
jgi:hypothetical protein